MDEFGRTEIFYSIVNGMIDLFKDQLLNTIDINHQDKNGMNLLHFACEYNRIEFVKLLLDKGIQIDTLDRYGNNPLWKAVFNSQGKYNVVDLLIENGADPNSMNKAGRSPLLLAETMGDTLMIKKLKEYKNHYGEN